MAIPEVDSGDDREQKLEAARGAAHEELRTFLQQPIYSDADWPRVRDLVVSCEEAALAIHRFKLGC